MIDLSASIDVFSEEQSMVRDAASTYFSQDEGFRRVRAHRGEAPGYDAALWSEMAELGWLGLRIPDEYGGMGASLGETLMLLEQGGRALAPEPLTASALLAAGVLVHGENETLKAEFLPRLVAGEWTPALAWQEAGAGQNTAADAVQATRNGSEITLSGKKCFVAAGEAADTFIVSAQTSEGTALYMVDSGADGVKLQSSPRVDGGFWGELSLHNVTVSEGCEIASAAIGSQLLGRVIDEARLAASAELVGLMSNALEISVEYIKTREQFGRPVGSFQALQHRAVNLFVLVEISRSVLMKCIAVFDETDDSARRAAAASQVKARCSSAALEVTKGCIHLHGGIGYTDECDIGLFLKKAMVLSEWLGGAAWHRQRFGAIDLQQNTADKEEDPFSLELRDWIAANFPQQWRFAPNRLSVREALSWHHKLYAKGWGAPGWPKEHGGMALSAYQQIQFQDELDRQGVNIAPNMGLVMLGPLLMRYATEAQKQRYLPKILAGETLWCQGYSEPGAGSDLAALRTSAVLDGEDFVVNGQKVWISSAHQADMMFLLVRTDPDAKKQAGISFLLVDMTSPGIEVNQIRNLSGGSEFCEVFFDNLRVPKENLIGELNEGWTMAKSLLGSERIQLGSPRLAKVPLERLRSLAQTLGVFDEPTFRARFDALCLDVDDGGAAFMRFADALRRGQELGAGVSILKIWMTEAAQRAADLIIEIAGQAGSLDVPLKFSGGGEVHAANLFFASRPMTIYGGTGEIQRNILAKAVLKLP